MTSGVALEPGAPATGRPPLPPGRTVDVPDRGPMFVRELPGPPGAPTALLIHGAAVPTSVCFHTVFEPLSRHVSIVAMDLRGHGQSLWTRRRFRLDDAADDVLALADHLGIDEFIPVGYSMGGAIGQLIWRDHPERVTGLVMAGTWSRFWRTRREKVLLRTIGRLGTAGRLLTRRRSLEVFMAAAARMSSIERRPPWIVAEVRAGSVPMMVESLGTTGRFDSSGWIGALDVPTGLLVLNRDDVVPPDRQHHLASLLPQADVRYLDLLHDDIVTQPERFVPTFVELVRDVAERSGG